MSAGLHKMPKKAPPAVTLLATVEQLIALYGQERHAEVVARCEGLIAVHPQAAMLYNILGAASIGLGDFAKAESAYTRAVALDPGDAEIHNNHGIALKSLGRLDEAVAAFDRALAIRAAYPEAHFNRGNALRAGQATEAAIAAYRRALALRPDYFDAWHNLGLARQQTGRRDEALACFGRALALRPNAAQVLHDLGNLLMEAENYPDAIKAFGLALAIDPARAETRGRQFYARAQVCDFSVYDDHRLARQSGGLPPGTVSPFTMLLFEEGAEAQLAYSRAWPGVTPAPQPLAARPAEPGRIRIGYFSADFHDHATMYLMSGLLREHDRAAFEIIAFSYGPDRDDAMRQALQARVDRFIDLRDMADAAVVDLVHAQQLDIAVDLKGYTQDSRSRLFVHRLAPVQINYLGFPGSMGGDFIDYVIADRVVVPAGHERFFAEKVIALPGSYQPNDDCRPIVDRGTTRSDFGLPESGFVFCCFNQNYKIGPREFDRWMRLLGRVEGSVLWLLRSNEWAEANLRREAEARGVDPARLIFADKLPHGEHLGRLRHADLFLDTFNVNAHTTASDALWAGLPVLTKAGEPFAARVAASLLHAVGLPELVAADEADYEAAAFRLATHANVLEDLRQRLTANRLDQPLFDTRRYTRALESAFVAVHDRHIQGLPPDHLIVS